MQNLRMGTFSAELHYFEHDDEFSPDAKRILDMYEQIAKKTYHLAECGILNNVMRKEAALWLCASKMLETLLTMYALRNPETKPDYSHFKHFVERFVELEKDN
jgi:hypothetical protein